MTQLSAPMINKMNFSTAKHKLAITFLIATLTACSNNSTSEDTSTEQSADTNTADATIEVETAESATDSLAQQINQKILQTTSIDYKTENWKKSTEEPLELTDVKSILSALGNVQSTDKNSLDYESSPAVKYRFMATDAPYLDIVDSTKYLEFGWYYANAQDTDNEKQTSVSHAKRLYELMTRILGEDGGQLVKDILSGQTIKNDVINGQTISLATCQFYSCMIVVDKKNDTSTTDTLEEDLKENEATKNATQENDDANSDNKNSDNKNDEDTAE